MVDFSKRLAKKDITKRIDPVELYDTLDRASDKGELRTAQRAILGEWHETLRSLAAYFISRDRVAIIEMIGQADTPAINAKSVSSAI
jgi:hypothetical protein